MIIAFSSLNVLQHFLIDEDITMFIIDVIVHVDGIPEFWV